MSEVKVWAVFLVWVGFLALIPTMMWFIILSVVAWGLNQSGVNRRLVALLEVLVVFRCVYFSVYWSKFSCYWRC